MLILFKFYGPYTTGTISLLDATKKYLSQLSNKLNIVTSISRINKIWLWLVLPLYQSSFHLQNKIK